MVVFRDGPCNFRPPNWASDWGVSPIWPITANPESINALTCGRIRRPPKNLRERKKTGEKKERKNESMFYSTIT